MDTTKSKFYISLLIALNLFASFILVSIFLNSFAD